LALFGALVFIISYSPLGKPYVLFSSSLAKLNYLSLFKQNLNKISYKIYLNKSQKSAISLGFLFIFQGIFLFFLI